MFPMKYINHRNFYYFSFFYTFLNYPDTFISPNDGKIIESKKINPDGTVRRHLSGVLNVSNIADIIYWAILMRYEFENSVYKNQRKENAFGWSRSSSKNVDNEHETTCTAKAAATRGVLPNLPHPFPSSSFPVLLVFLRGRSTVPPYPLSLRR